MISNQHPLFVLFCCWDLLLSGIGVVLLFLLSPCTSLLEPSNLLQAPHCAHRETGTPSRHSVSSLIAHLSLGCGTEVDLLHSLSYLVYSAFVSLTYLH